MLKAVTRSARQVDDRVAEINSERAMQRKPNVTIAGFFDHYATDADLQVLVEEQDFELARRELVPSVSVDELRHYESVRDQFEGGAKKQAQAQEIDQPHAQAGAPREDERKAAAKAKFNELMRKQLSKNKAPTVNGYEAMVTNGQQAETGAEASDGDDDFVVRTDKLTLGGGNGRAPSRPTSARSNAKAKGKGKGREEPVGDGVDGGGEDLYD